MHVVGATNVGRSVVLITLVTVKIEEMVACSSKHQQRRRHLPEMFLNQAKHTFSRPGIINYPHTYMPSEHFPGGVDSMCIFLSFI